MGKAPIAIILPGRGHTAQVYHHRVVRTRVGSIVAVTRRRNLARGVRGVDKAITGKGDGSVRRVGWRGLPFVSGYEVVCYPSRFRGIGHQFRSSSVTLWITPGVSRTRISISLKCSFESASTRTIRS